MDNLKTLYIIWDDIIFETNQIQFDISRIKTILQPVRIQGVIKSLNLVKGDYFQRLYGKKAFKLTFVSGVLDQTPASSPGWVRLLDAIEFVGEYYAFKIEKKHTSILRRGSNLSNTEILDLYDEILSKSEYLKFLANRLNADFKLIPILEFSNGHAEDSFLFRFKNKRGDILIVWENANPNRATYIFKYNIYKHQEVLKKIETFIKTEEYDHKRSLLSGKNLISRETRYRLCFYKKYNHHSPEEFKSEIEYLIAYS